MEERIKLGEYESLGRIYIKYKVLKNEEEKYEYSCSLEEWKAYEIKKILLHDQANEELLEKFYTQVYEAGYQDGKTDYY